MADRAELGGGFTVLDSVALVTGAAVASVHIRPDVPELEGPWDWAWAWCLFTWLSTTSAGPFVYLVRRIFTRPSGYPRLGDRLWAVVGLPWFLAALVKTGDPADQLARGPVDPAYAGCLTIGLAVSSMIVVPVLAARFLLGDPKRLKKPEPAPWTHNLGLTLSIAWPIQCAVGLVVMS
jgi:hypothetical protein